jgi:hypothetical protein
MNRRSFMLAIALATAAATPACEWTSIIDRIRSYVGISLLAFDRIIEILTANGIALAPGLTAIVNAVKAAIADILTAVEEYRAAAAHDKATMIAALKTALTVASARLMEFWAMLRIPNPQLAQTIKALIDVIISTLEGFKAQLPGQPLAPQRFLGNPRPRTVKEFKNDFNAILTRAGDTRYAI